MMSKYLTSSRCNYANIQLNTKNEVVEFCDAMKDKILTTFTITINEMKCERIHEVDGNDGFPSTVVYFNMVLRNVSHVKKFKSILLTILPNYRCTIFSIHADYTSLLNNDAPYQTTQEEEIYCTMAPQSATPIPPKEEESLTWDSATTYAPSFGEVYETLV